MPLNFSVSSREEADLQGACLLDNHSLLYLLLPNIYFGH